MNLFEKEPALITQVISAIIALAVAFGLHLTPEQTGAIMGLGSLIAAFITRSQVTPNANVQATVTGGATENATPAVAQAAPPIPK